MKTDSQRRRLRRIIMLVMSPLLLAALVMSIKFISISAMADASASAYERRSWTESTTQAEPLNIWNIVETWKAPFDTAVGLAMRGSEADLAEALQLLQHALELQGNPGSADYCVIYTNIVYVIEKQGDSVREAGDQSAANELYQQALQLIEESPEGCLDDTVPGEPNTQEQLNESVPRIEEKIVEEESEGGQSEGDPEEGESEGEPSEGDEPQDPQQSQLEEQNQQSQTEQQQQQDYDPNGEPGEGGGVDSPW